MKILITGINGFVGSSLATILGKENYIIGTGTKESSIVEVDDYFRWNMGEESIPLEKIPDDIDVIVHAAANLDKDNMNEQLITTNCLGTHRIYQLAKQKKAEKVFYLSSIPIIGIPQVHPITENHPLTPQTMYHVTKLSGELILNQLIYEGIEVIHMRLPSPIGAGMPVKTILPIFIKKAINGETIELVGKGSRRQNYLDVRDLGMLIARCLTMEEISGTYNIASAETISNLELAKLCVELTESDSNIEFLDMVDNADGQVWDVDSSKAVEQLGFRQQYTIQQSVKDIITEMRKAVYESK